MTNARLFWVAKGQETGTGPGMGTGGGDRNRIRGRGGVRVTKCGATDRSGDRVMDRSRIGKTIVLFSRIWS